MLHPYEEYALKLPMALFEPMWLMNLHFRNVRIGCEVWTKGKYSND